MVAKSAEKLWTMYPGSHLHCEVTKSGLHTYRISMTLFDQTEEQVASIEHYGSGDLPKLKEAAFERLVGSLGIAAT